MPESTIADRLQGALSMAGDLPDVRAFFREMDGRGNVQTTYSTVARYFSGDVKEPPLPFLEEAAGILGVEAGWLAFGPRQVRAARRPMSTLAERLSEVIETSGMTREDLIKALQSREAPGASYPSIRSYLREENPVEPALAFVRALAEIVGMRPEWITYGSGPKYASDGQPSMEGGEWQDGYAVGWFEAVQEASARVSSMSGGR